MAELVDQSKSLEREPLRRRLYIQIEPAAWPRRGLSPVNKVVCGLILAASLLAILETEITITGGHEILFLRLELAFASVFLVEYAARVWTAAENPEYGPGWRGRLRYITSFAAVIDLLALLPALLMAWTPYGSEAFVLRLIRLMRILRMARLGRFSSAMALVSEAIRSRSYELLLSVAVAGTLLVFSSTLLYIAEAGIQPEEFGSIPRAMWWSIATLTTVGYGDVYPLTAIGRLFAAMTAITGIGLIAMPTGILAAAMSDAIQRQREGGKAES